MVDLYGVTQRWIDGGSDRSDCSRRVDWIHPTDEDCSRRESASAEKESGYLGSPSSPDRLISQAFSDCPGP